LPDHFWAGIVSRATVEIVVGCLLAALVIYLLYRIVRAIRQSLYFHGTVFRSQRDLWAAFVADCNDLNQYIDSLNVHGSLKFSSDSGQYAGLSRYTNTSHWNYRRDRNTVTYAPEVHNCSLQIVRRAHDEPIKYLEKYFGIKPTEEHLTILEEVSNSLANVREGKQNLWQRRMALMAKIDPPKFIKKHYLSKFWRNLGFTQVTIGSTIYPTYKFEYVSAGGNSAQETTIRLDSDTIDALVEDLRQKIRFRKSAAGQRALMTASLREYIKSRDHFSCRQCGISQAAEPHLLLEIDHIIPVSKGGLTAVDNLQALCWKCNRTKSSKLLHGD